MMYAIKTYLKQTSFNVLSWSIVGILFWLGWTVLGIGEKYFYYLPTVFHHISLLESIGAFIVLNIIKSLIPLGILVQVNKD